MDVRNTFKQIQVCLKVPYHNYIYLATNSLKELDVFLVVAGFLGFGFFGFFGFFFVVMLSHMHNNFH